MNENGHTSNPGNPGNPGNHSNPGNGTRPDPGGHVHGDDEHVESMLEDSGVLPIRTTLLQGATFAARPVQYVEVGGLAVVEGDIVVGTAEQAEQAMADDPSIAHGVVVTGERARWDRGVVPYEIDPGLPNQARITSAVAHWHAETGIRLVPRTAGNAAQHPDYVRFIPDTGCYSSVGRRGGRQDIGLAAGCGTGSVIHEIGHAVGLWHEQSREDRDSYVSVNYANIEPGLEHNFNQHLSDGDDVGRYDYASIMHYPRKAFSKNGGDTIVPTQSGVVIGQRSGLSDGDVAAVRYMYPNLEPSTQWLGLQLTGTVPASSTRTWFTFRWPAHWYVSWIVVPETPGAAVSWSLRTERSATEDRYLTYYISVTNHDAGSAATFEARYVVHGWTPAARDPEAGPADQGGLLDGGRQETRTLVVAPAVGSLAPDGEELAASTGELVSAGAQQG